MSKPAKDAIMRRCSTVAYTRAYKRGPTWSKIFSPEIVNFIQSTAASLNSTDTNVLASFLTAISAIVGRNGKVDMPGGKGIYLNVFFILIGRPGCGKSAAMHEFLLSPLKRIENEKQIHILMQDCTPAGLLAFLGETNGAALYASDECCQRLATMLANRRHESSSMRSTLNTLYSGYGVQKVFATKSNINMQDAFFGIFGTTQPHPFVEFLSEVEAVNDGLIDRFFPIVSQPGRSKIPENYVMQPPNDWVYRSLKRLHDIHSVKANGIRSYVFEEEAKEIFLELQKESEDNIEEAYRELEEMVDDANVLAHEIPTESGDSKSFEYIAKMSALLHIAKSILTAVTAGTPENLEINCRIMKDDVEHALQLITLFSIQRNEFKDFLTTEIPYGMQRQAQQVIDNKDQDLHKIILLFPGTAVSVQMILRKHRYLRNRSLEVRETMKAMTTQKGQPRFVGIFKTLGKNQTVFYKAPLNSIDKNYLADIGITDLQYKDAYKSDMTTAPAPGIADDWKTYYQGIIRGKPGIDDLGE